MVSLLFWWVFNNNEASAGQFCEHRFRMEGQIEKILIISHIKTDQET